MSELALWGGVECTINRVGDTFNDQLRQSGLYETPGPIIDGLAAVGFERVRWPVLWERIAPDGLARADWAWADETLGRWRAHGVEPIVGLVHHGSGPRATHLLDPGFAAGLADFAAAVAARYPWVRFYTPVNEPLTTARFSALYGHWYPHRKDDLGFATALVVQCRAIVEAMAAIRRVQPDADLVFTEDASSTRSTPEVAAQAAFENERRWLSLDLVTGRVDARHTLWSYLMGAGVPAADLDDLRARACAPAIVGLNYYVTSDRFLDHRVQRYPWPVCGGNGRQQYADVEAARVDGIGIRGHTRVLLDAWQRYRLPLAITEAHLGCTREEQMRWLVAAWRGARQALAEGVDVRAVTAWALLGSRDWDSLVTIVGRTYEPGLFDVRTQPPRPTALAAVARSLASTGAASHALLDTPGWWEPPEPARAPVASVDAATLVASGGDQGMTTAGPLLVIGVNGTLGSAFAIACERRGIVHRGLSRRALDISDAAAVRAAIDSIRPWAVVNAAGYVRVDEAERDPRACRTVNAVGPAILASVCRRAGIPLLTFSSDLVFDGQQQAPYLEGDAVAPLNVYGHTKAEAERRVLALNPSSLVVRTSAFFGPWDRWNFVTRTLDELQRLRAVRVPDDVTVSPTYVPDLVDACLDLLIDGADGVWHLANPGAVTWAEFARRAARMAGMDAAGVQPCEAGELQLAARRPAYSVLGTSRGLLLPPLDDSLARYFHERARVGSAA